MWNKQPACDLFTQRCLAWARAIAHCACTLLRSGGLLLQLAAPLAKTEPLCCCMSNVCPPPLPSGAIPCSYAGRAFEREEEAEAGEGELICKGMRSMWRQVSAALLAV